MSDDNVIPFPGPSQSPREWLTAFQAALGASTVDSRDDGWGGPKPVLLKSRKGRARFVVRVDLDDVTPPIWRRLRLASDLTLSELHEVLQIAMGWTDSHLHQFKMGPDAKDFRMQPFLTQFDLQEGETGGVVESRVRLDEVLGKPGHRLFYEYDFGDGWHHTIKLEKIEAWVEGDPEAWCVTGRRSCPPEDVGGPWGYAEVLSALAGEFDPDRADFMEDKLDWLPSGFDPAAFDLDEVNTALQSGPLPPLEEWHPGVSDLVGRDGSWGATGLTELVKTALNSSEDVGDAIVEQATLRYRVLLRTIGGGVQLTEAGYLPPRVVDSLCRELDLGEEWVGKGNREHLTLPVLTLRESATALGLVRKSRGRVTVTKAGLVLVDDPWGLLNHNRTRVPLGRGFERDAGMLALLFAAAGRDWWRSRSQAAEIAVSLGWIAEGGDLGRAVSQSARSTLDVLDHLAGRRESAEYRSQIARLLLRR